jgi:hypothetical protein
LFYAQARRHRHLSAREPHGATIQWQLARMPVTADADKNTKANQAARRIKFGMNPDLRQPGF